MRRSQQFNLIVWCAAAAIGFSLAGCGDDIIAPPSLNEACSEDKPCAEGLVCSDSGKCIEKPAEKAGLNEDCDAKKLCQDGLICGDEGKCIEKPAEKSELGETCDEEKACKAGLVCKEGICAKEDSNVNLDPCEGVTCLDGQECLEGRCYDNECIIDNAVKSCGEGQMCSKGECIDDGCQEVICKDGEVCVKGICEDQLCLEKAVNCKDGTTCVKGECIDNECLSQTCDNGLVCAKGDCVYPACVGKEPCALGKSCDETGTCVFPEIPAIQATPDKTETDENGGVATVSLVLNNPPASSVTVTCVLEGAEGEAEVNCDGILFDAQNYSELQAIYVTGLADNVIDEDKPYALTITTNSDDPEFNGLSQKIDLVNKNVDAQGVYVNAPELLTTTESGGSASFTVVLKAKPEADVTFVVSTDHPEYGAIEGAVENKLTITFTPENWDIPQEIKVIGVDDDETPNDSEHTYQVVFENTVSDDENYKDLPINPINAINLDNDVAQVFLDKESVVTEEGGAGVDITMRLGLMPTKDVNVMVEIFENKRTLEPTDEVVLDSPAEFKINQDNYNEGVHVLFHGVDDHFIDGDQDYVIRIQFNSFDEQYKFLEEIWIDGKNIDMNIAGLSKNYTETKVSEDGTSLDLGISLMSIPTAAVTVDLSVTDDTEISIDTQQLVFTPETWNQEQVIKVTGLNDVIIDGDIVSELNMLLTSEDVHFGGDGAENLPLSDKFEVTTLDNDSAAIVVVAEGAEVMENSGKTLEFKVMLSAQPQGEVSVNAKSLDESELIITNQPTMIFNETNWDQPQTIFLAVQDDNEADGNQQVQIQLTSTSEDADFNKLIANTPVYNVLDNEQASIALTLAKPTLAPGDYTTTVSVALSALPLSNVTVTLNTTNADTATLGQTTLTFTKENWDKPQTVTLTNTSPQKANTAKSTETISASSTGEGQYNNLKSNNVVVTLYAFKEKSFAYTGALQEIALLPGRYKLEVYGSQGTAGWDGGIVGLGGYSYGTYQLATAKTLYVCVGGNAYHAATESGGYNGGGYGHAKSGGARGGGATHIAIAKRGVGVLKDYVSNQNDVLIVAGGAGGVEWAGTGGAGGGSVGGQGTSVKGTNGAAVAGAPGTQSAGGASAGYGSPSVLINGGFGFGGYGYRSDVTAYGHEGDYGGGGGGGWYGGGGTSYAGAGSGGSSHIGPGVTGGVMQQGKNANVGSAKITLLD